MTLKFLLHPQRANRLVLQKSLDNSQLGLSEVLKTLVKNSFGKQYEDSYFNELQHHINTNVLKYLMNLATNEQSYFQTKAAANAAITDISKNLLNTEASSMQYGLMVKEFYEHPEKFKLKDSPKIPDGSPIGSGSCEFHFGG